MWLIISYIKDLYTVYIIYMHEYVNSHIYFKGLNEDLIPAACVNVSNHLSALLKEGKVGQ
jgi:hypothetical protein